MKVIAIREGFFDGHRILAGQEFDVPEGAKASWFTPSGVVAEETAKRVKVEPKGKQARTLSELGKQQAHGPTDTDLA